MALRSSARNHLLIGVGVLATVVLCVVLVDRPVAIWFDTHFRGTTASAAANTMFRVLDAFLVIGVLLLPVSVIVVRRREKSPRWARLASGLTAGLVSLAVTMVLKVVIGRSQVGAPFFRDHIYTFHILAGVNQYMAFPSATMSATTGFLAGFGSRALVRRVLGVVLLVLLAVALLVTDGHWLGDIVAGTYLGWAVGSAIARRRPEV